MRHITVMFTAVCGWPTHATCNALRGSKNAKYTIIGVDCNPYDTAKNYVDHLYKVPRYYEDGYCDEILAICMKHGVELVIPLISEEIDVLRAHGYMFSAHGIRFPWTDSDGLFGIANDKKLCQDFLEARGLFVFPKTVMFNSDIVMKDLEGFGYPHKYVVLKLRDGCGGVGFKVLNNDKAIAVAKAGGREARANPYITLDQFMEIASTNPERYMVQEYVPGAEMSTLCLVDHGRTIYSPSHENFAMQYATTTYCELVDCEEATEIATEANRLLKLNGNIGYDFKRDEDGKLKLLEINPRISATVSLAVKAGLNIVEYGVFQGLGIPFPEDVVPLYGMRLQRVYGTLYSYKGEPYGT